MVTTNNFSDSVRIVSIVGVFVVTTFSGGTCDSDILSKAIKPEFCQSNRILSQAQVELLDRIQSFNKLDKNWDTYGANPINKGIIKQVESFILDVSNYKYINVFPVPNGNIQIELEDSNEYLEFEFLTNNKVKVFKINSKGQESEKVFNYSDKKQELIRMVDSFGC
ncbi:MULTISPECIES: hypothetical protein [unclassified Veillonella]|jgi:hypothetical protein|uniref:Uncharacterized protein n=1 Tax=Veillonella orientalis TaxID=2682455 RepID=A0ABM7HEN6_9FIRM|nr:MULTISPECIES: hypothetical protein [unclassified Veillonella]ETJ22604.1 MAG: hypothetical protein Q620_VSAC00159G0002 [Veillonella sp. DORA_A_3_16_22]MBS4891649.1 hypothetical protein [Veillonella sp.]BBU35491.1 hypothetical protein VEIS1202513_00120 [Veillonella sp. S12025-13]